jgi:hypothetical protein
MVDNSGSYIAPQRVDWYAVENLIAYGFRPIRAVSSDTDGAAQLATADPVEQHDWSVSLMGDSSESVPVVRRDPERGAA